MMSILWDHPEGGYVSLPEPSSVSKESFIAVKFDTRFDPMIADINGYHIDTCQLGLQCLFLLLKLTCPTSSRGSCVSVSLPQMGRALKVLTSLSLADIRSATMGFNRNRVLGKGHQLRFIKGLCTLVGEVAIKMFERADGIRSLHHSFTTEFATMVGCLRHKNLIQLHGWCCEGNELVLVYEYIAQWKPQQSSPQKLQFSRCPILEART
ncbi:L-type lectin-domain containing receptor kinase S.6 [Pyrus ussuriensis x Pyrus communis]|uniref:L-type lectin-domain containing receptor kinase S.6 n=1 Tax=Pyrus ussuriensis x Pyrus communis TaxID=2448454 RepID=A0A5N5FKC0_9ROSA|nr:L-type lectin-domain containing receptor kinase S.6 [Pyrus ussuriensis x Pyrus communis]